MVYNIKKTSASELVKDERLINSIMTKKPELSQKEAREQIIKSWHIVESFVKKDKPVFTSDHPPCHNCGSTNFQRTGTCHVCMTCFESQGCS